MQSARWVLAINVGKTRVLGFAIRKFRIKGSRRENEEAFRRRVLKVLRIAQPRVAQPGMLSHIVPPDPFYSPNNALKRCKKELERQNKYMMHSIVGIF